jgi:uncharacterized repeat protein (TIGR03803 family)
MNFERLTTGSSAYAAPLLASNNIFYGTTYDGGMHGFGTMYQYDPEGDEYTILHHFQSYQERPGNGSLLEVQSEFGIEDHNMPHPIGLYPNPASEFLYIRVHSNPLETLQLRIYNMIGQSEMEVPFNGNNEQEIRIDISELEEGVYFLQFINGNQVFSSKFVKTE